MELLLNLISIYFAFRITKKIIYIFRVIKTSKSQNATGNVERDNVDEVEINKWSSKISEIKKASDIVGTVTDEICGITFPREEAYIIIKDGTPHYFCSWDCRQKFIDNSKKGN